jgi:hypothetical protein
MRLSVIATAIRLLTPVNRDSSGRFLKSEYEAKGVEADVLGVGQRSGPKGSHAEGWLKKAVYSAIVFCLPYLSLSFGLSSVILCVIYPTTVSLFPD